MDQLDRTRTSNDHVMLSSFVDNDVPKVDAEIVVTLYVYAPRAFRNETKRSQSRRSDTTSKAAQSLLLRNYPKPSSIPDIERRNSNRR